MVAPKTLVVDCEVLGAPRSGIGVYLEQVLSQLQEPRLHVERRGGRSSGSRTLGWKSRLRRVPGAYAARSALVGWPPVPDDAVFFGPNFLLPPWPLVRDRTVITVHDLLFFEHPEWADVTRGAALRAQLHSSIGRASAVVATTERTWRSLHERFQCGEKTHVIPLGIRRFDLPPRSRDERPVLVIGNVEPRKDPMVALHAHRKLPAALRRAHPLWIIGGALDRQYAAQLELALDAPYSRWFDHMTDADLADALAHAAVCIAPSRAEGYGLVPLEALGARVPVIVADIPVARELCGDLATYFAPGATDSLARELEDALCSPRTIDPKALIKKHDWRAVGHAHAELFLSL